MLKFIIKRTSAINRDDIFSLSTNIEQFSNLMPKYFKSLKIKEKINSDFFVEEEILFFKKTLKVKTKHVIEIPSIHKIYILSGVLKNSSFIETYGNFPWGTKVIIVVNLNFNGFFKLLYLFKPIIGNRVNKIMDDFISRCEIQLSNSHNLKN